PTDVNYDSHDATTGTYDPSSSVWTVGVLPVAQSEILTIYVTVASPLPNDTVLTNTAWLDADQIHPISDTEGTTVESSPVLTITKRDDPDPVNAGGTLQYTVVISNSGNENATSVLVREQYDPNVSFVYASPAPDSGSNNREWTFPSLETGTSEAIDIIVQVASPLDPDTVLTNLATLESDQTDPVTVTETTAVTSTSKLTVSKGDLPDPVPAGDRLEYIITYQNGGTAAAEDVVITETYDSRVTLVSADPPPERGTDNVWEIGELGVNDVGWIRVILDVETPLPNGTVLTNVVTIDSADTSPQAYTETTRVSSSPDLSLSVADHPDPVEAGHALSYTVSYTNVGNADATGVVVTATLDSNVSFDADATDPTPDDGSGSVWTWDIGDIPGEGGQGEIVIATQVTLPLTNGTALDFSVQLGYSEGAPLEETAQTNVTSAPELSLQKTDHDYVVYAGDRLTYTLSYANAGNENAYDVTITDTLPSLSYVEYESCQAVHGTCSDLDDQVLFHLDVITAQTTGEASVIVSVRDPLPAGADEILNRAELAHASLSAPIEAEDLDVIGTRPDLVITATHEPRLFSPGQAMTYTITHTNTGRMDAENVIITATLPANAAGSIEGVSDGWTLVDGELYTYHVGNLDADTVGPVVTLVVSNTDTVQIGFEEFDAWFAIAEQRGDRWDANPADNVAPGYIGVPDLVVTDFTFEPEPLQPNVSITFTVKVQNQGTAVAENAALPRGPFAAGIFFQPVASYPWTGNGAIYDYIPPIPPGVTHTHVITMTSPFPDAQRIQFSEEQIREEIRGFFIRVDNDKENPHGLVPEYNEWNNVAQIVLRPWNIYLPLVVRN
ncbi:MAG: hypothetical protein ACOC7N_04735, partial [Chloroflexota bacterium]